MIFLKSENSLIFSIWIAPTIQPQNKQQNLLILHFSIIYLRKKSKIFLSICVRFRRQKSGFLCVLRAKNGKK